MNVLYQLFDPATGKNMIGNHFCLVGSPNSLSTKLTLTMRCPVSGGTAHVAREARFIVSLIGPGLRRGLGSCTSVEKYGLGAARKTSSSQVRGKSAGACISRDSGLPSGCI